MYNPALEAAELDCLLALYTSDYESHKKRNDPPVEGTCRWFLQHEKYLHWHASNVSELLWLSADPGCGKSVLTSFLIDHESSKIGKIPQAKSFNVCYVFFKDDSEDQRTALFALSAILYQIFSCQPRLIKHAIGQFSTKGPQANKQFLTLWNILKDTIEDEDLLDTVCYLDGIDECEEESRKLLVECLADYFGSARQNAKNSNYSTFKILLTSRPSNAIKSAFKSLSDIRLKGEDETESTTFDVELVVQSRINELRGSDLPEEVLKDLQRQLTKKADRTFLWTTLIIKLLKDAVESGVSEKELNAILESRDIDDVYERMLKGRSYPNMTKKMLYIVLAAARPLTLDEMNIAMSIEPRNDVDIAQDSSTIWKAVVDASTHLNSHNYEKSQDFSGSVIGRFKKTENNVETTKFSVAQLDDLRSKMKYPFGNHVYFLCGHFLRIIRGKIYLVHQTARDFLVHREWEHGFISKSHQRAHENPEHYIVSQAIKEVEDLEDVWKRSISLFEAHRILLDICRDYMIMFSSSKHPTYQEPNIYQTIKSSMEGRLGKLLEYSANYWTLHFKETIHAMDFEARQRYESLCNPNDPAFDVWTPRNQLFSINFPSRDLSRIPGTGSLTQNEVLELFDISNWPRLREEILEDVKLDDNDYNDEDDDDDNNDTDNLESKRRLSHRSEHFQKIYSDRRIDHLMGLESGRSHPARGHSFPQRKGTNGFGHWKRQT
jgi:hypothetical protein